VKVFEVGSITGADRVTRTPISKEPLDLLDRPWIAKLDSRSSG